MSACTYMMAFRSQITGVEVTFSTLFLGMGTWVYPRQQCTLRFSVGAIRPANAFSKKNHIRYLVGRTRPGFGLGYRSRRNRADSLTCSFLAVEEGAQDQKQESHLHFHGFTQQRQTFFFFFCCVVVDTFDRRG